MHYRAQEIMDFLNPLRNDIHILVVMGVNTIQYKGFYWFQAIYIHYIVVSKILCVITM